MKQPASIGQGGVKPWRCVAPLLGTVAAATVLTVSLPSAQAVQGPGQKFVPPKDQTLVAWKQPWVPDAARHGKKEHAAKALACVAVGIASAALLAYGLKKGCDHVGDCIVKDIYG